MAESDAEQAVRIAKSILDGSAPVFLGCKQLCGLLHRLGLDRDKPYVTIVGVESETDHLPILPHDRLHWNKEVLARKDAELAAYLPQIEASVMTACRAIIARYSEG
jgi:hypothetical protein